MEWFEAVILGLIQGLTEFLPVSSSGHLEIGKELLGVQTTDDLMFTTMVHAATVLSTIVVFRKQIWSLLKGFFRFKYNDETDYVLKLFEEVGELSRAIYRDTRAAADDDFRGSVEEELWDVMYYVLCLANLYDVDMEKWIKIKKLDYYQVDNVKQLH